MTISNDDIFKLVNILPEETKQSAGDFLKFLIIRHTRPEWIKTDQMEPDDMWVKELKAKNISKLFHTAE